MTEPIGVVGAGTMGAGIAQVAAVAGRRVLLADAVPGAAERAIAKIRDRVKAQVEKGRLDADPAALDLTAVEIAGLGECGVVAEAIVEELGAKKALFAELEGVVGAGLRARVQFLLVDADRDGRRAGASGAACRAALL